MRWFQRKKGRHALGAAVTSIPSGPLLAPSEAPAVALPALPRQSDVMSAIAELIATGEAWAEPTPRPAAPAQARVWTPELAATSARGRLETVLEEMQAPEAASATAEFRVQLGFRDGSSADLDPSSQQSLALEELARNLTRRS